jgi:hypothetical protein
VKYVESWRGINAAAIMKYENNESVEIIMAMAMATASGSRSDNNIGIGVCSNGAKHGIENGVA